MLLWFSIKYRIKQLLSYYYYYLYLMHPKIIFLISSQWFIIRSIIIKTNIYKQNCSFLKFSMLGTKWRKIFNVIIYRTFYHFLLLQLQSPSTVMFKKAHKNNTSIKNKFSATARARRVFSKLNAFLFKLRYHLLPLMKNKNSKAGGVMKF